MSELIGRAKQRFNVGDWVWFNGPLPGSRLCGKIMQAEGRPVHFFVDVDGQLYDVDPDNDNLWQG